MAGPNNDDQNRDTSKRTSPEDENPFITFRRFADQQVNTLVNTVFSLPSAFSSSFMERRRCPWRDENRRRGLDQPSRAEPDDEHDDEFGPFERMFRDMENAVENEVREFEKIWKDADNSKVKECHGQTPSREPKVYYWSWNWPPKSAEETEREKEEYKREVMSRAEMWKRIWDRPDLLWSPFDCPRGVVSRNEDLYEQWEDYLLHDAYSPLQLEKSENLGLSKADWRHAYEDLLSETVQSASAFPRGRLYYVNDRDRAQMSPQQWIQHLQSRHDSMWRSTPHGPIPLPREAGPSATDIPRMAQEIELQCNRDGHRKDITWSDDARPASEYAGAHHDSTDESDSEPQSELDMYERFLGSSSPSQSTAASSNPRPSILSTLTTTERTVHADGTVTTKVVLKKRFADGREESSETVHTSKGDKSQLEDARSGILSAVEKSANMPEHLKEQKGKKRSWFWSS